MPRASLSFRPTEAQRQWLDRQRRERGIPVTTVIQLLLEQAIATDQEPHAKPWTHHPHEVGQADRGAVAGGPAPRGNGRLVDR